MKTRIEFKADQPQEPFRKGDTGYIDGYLRGGDGRPCAIVVGDDGHIGFAFTYNLKAITSVADDPEPLGLFDTKFECPECKGMYWGTSHQKIGGDWGHCHDQFGVGCSFKWNRNDDDKYMVPRDGEVQKP